MDPIQQMHEACEGMIFSTKGSRKRYMNLVASIEADINAGLDKYESLYKLSDELTAKASQIEDEKERAKFIAKNMQPITDFCLRYNILDMNPVEHLKGYKAILTTSFNKADRKNPEVKAACDEMMKKLNPGGELYAKAKAMQDKFAPNSQHAAIAASGSRDAAANVAMQQQMALQQQMLIQQQQQMQMQIQLELDRQMRDQMQRTTMMAMGLPY
jgi:hypothetical protein